MKQMLKAYTLNKRDMKRLTSMREFQYVEGSDAGSPTISDQFKDWFLGIMDYVSYFKVTHMYVVSAKNISGQCVDTMYVVYEYVVK